MTPEQREIYKKLNDLDLDKDKYSMVDRLAKENKWPKEFALAVFHEYKKFVFLAKFSGHMVTPSYELDQAWHTHMIYTRSYWNVMCKGILDMQLHHTPGNGEPGDEKVFQKAYQQTKESYKKFFGRECPPEIWDSWHRPKEEKGKLPLYKKIINTLIRIA